MILYAKILQNGKTYIDKDFGKNFDIKRINDYGYSVLNIDDKYCDCQSEDFDGFYFNVEKYNARKSQDLHKLYENMIVSEIRKKYSLNQELAILRQKDSKFYEYQEYFEYVEQCKSKAKQFFNMV